MTLPSTDAFETYEKSFHRYFNFNLFLRICTGLLKKL